VVTVAIQDCEETLAEIYQQINQMIEEDKKLEREGLDLADTGSSRSVLARRHYLVLHFGVYKGCGAFNIEFQGKNIKDFFIPDERGNTPMKECID
jgi:pyrrolidone-carboxylate peptidase